MKKFAILFIGALFLLTSCEETESPIYDQGSQQTLVSWGSPSTSVGVFPGQTVNTTIEINASRQSTVERTVTISVSEESSSAAAENYIIPTSFTIPANTYFASFDVTITDASLGLTPSTIVLNLDTVDDGGNTTTNIHTISAFELAPLTGEYLIEQTSALIDGPTLATGTVVEVNYVSSTQRSFDTANYPNYCSTPNTFTFDLVGGVTGEIVVPVQNSNCPCSSGANWFGPADGPNETYDLNDDSVFFVTFADDVQEDCGAVADTTYRFTKQ
ncbi:hypothetical protein KORDIASMS9_00085 [Kordia sp. SMS9]|uniref:hypothetical protein n=1 Tax=Kordia sp. SMS9 TaxID=2282170 RepID=UPI000E0D5805|nr:hypothetical protein [Kordia sp. SMS9]AXG67903.1 hypothetical protein KORDIASMS9_00085 [Kordia sp. SMS9]